MSRWRKRPKTGIPDYSGPYRRDMLEDARRELMSIIDSKDTIVWNRIRKKSGIFPNGERDTSFPGWGQASCDFSHADLKDSLDLDQSKDSNKITCTNNQPHSKSSTQQTSSSSGMTRSSSPSKTINGNLSDEAKSPDVIHIHDNDSDLYRVESPEAICLDSDTEEAIPVKNTGQGKSTNILPLDSGLTDYATVKRPANELYGKADSLIERSESFESNESECKITVEVIEGDMIEEGEVADNCLSTDNTHHIESEWGGEISSLSGEENIVEKSQGVLDTVPDSQEQKVFFKCDFCDVITEDKDPMYQHLKQMVHYSASSFYGHSDKTLVQLKERLVMTNKHALYKGVLAVCPSSNCSKVFRTIHESSLHYTTQHDSSSPSSFYGLVKVVNQCTCNVSTSENKRKCSDCKKRFKTNEKYVQHIMRSGHDLPFKLEKKLDNYFLCLACLEFHKTFISKCSHETTDDYGKMKLRPVRVLYGSKKEVHYFPGRLPKNLTNPGLFPKGIKRKRTTDELTEKKRAHYTLDPDMDDASTKVGSVQTSNVLGSHGSNIETDINKTNGSKILTGEHTQSKLEGSELHESYKCDYCEVISGDTEFVRGHLQEKKHSSASLILLNASGTPVYLKRPMEIQYCEEERSLMAVCPAPDCNQAFANIYICSEHYSHNHDEAADPTYAIASVETQQIIYCKLYEDNKSKFNVKTSMGDCVISDIDSFYKCFLCSCNVTFSNHAWLTAHLNRYHKTKRQYVSPRFVHILLVSKTKEIHTLLPYQTDRLSEVACIRNRIKNLWCLKRAASSSKANKTYKKKIQELKQLIRPSFSNNIGASDMTGTVKPHCYDN